MLKKLLKVIRCMLMNGADKWEDALKTGVVVPLFKKGDREDPGNYRDNYIGSRILARDGATRLWAEAVGLLDDNHRQAGFRSGRATADATQMKVRIQEYAVDLKKRIEEEVEKESFLQKGFCLVIAVSGVGLLLPIYCPFARQ